MVKIMQTQEWPLVSVIMSVYSGNISSEFKRSLLSMAVQDYPNLETVLVFDGPVSEDVHQAVTDVQNISKCPIRVIPLETNGGLGPALNTAIADAKGEFLARMDSDDYSLPDRISAQMKFLLENPEVDVLGCVIKDTFINGREYVLLMPKKHEDCVTAFSWRHPINHPTAVFRRRFFDKAGLYPINAKLDEDSALWLAGIKSGCVFSNINEAKYVRYLDDKFFKRRGKFEELWAVLKMRLRIVSELNYGIKGYLCAFTRFALLFFPRFISNAVYYVRVRLFGEFLG